jgi:hypothetical protein
MEDALSTCDLLMQQFSEFGSKIKKGIAKMGRALIQHFMIRLYADPPRDRSNLVDEIVDGPLRPHRKLAIDQDIS